MSIPPIRNGNSDSLPNDQIQPPSNSLLSNIDQIMYAVFPNDVETVDELPPPPTVPMATAPLEADLNHNRVAEIAYDYVVARPVNTQSNTSAGDFTFADLQPFTRNTDVAHVRTVAPPITHSNISSLGVGVNYSNMNVHHAAPSYYVPAPLSNHSNIGGHGGASSSLGSYTNSRAPASHGHSGYQPSSHGSVAPSNAAIAQPRIVTGYLGGQHADMQSLVCDEAVIQEMYNDLPNLDVLKDVRELPQLKKVLTTVKFPYLRQIAYSYPVPMRHVHVDVAILPHLQWVASQAAKLFALELFNVCPYLKQRYEYGTINAESRWDLAAVDMKTKLDRNIFSWRVGKGAEVNIQDAIYAPQDIQVFMTVASQFNGSQASHPVTACPGMEVEVCVGVRSQGTAIRSEEQGFAEALNVIALAGFNGLAAVLGSTALPLLYAYSNGYLIPDAGQIKGVAKAFKENWQKLEMPRVKKRNITFMCPGAIAARVYNKADMGIDPNAPNRQESRDIQYYAALANFQAQFNLLADTLQEKEKNKRIICILNAVGCGTLGNDQGIVGEAFRQCALAFQKQYLEPNGIGGETIKIIFESHPMNPTGEAGLYASAKLKENPTPFLSEFGV